MLNDKYINKIKDLEYPEYSHASDAEPDSVDLGLTDLSLSEKDSLGTGLKKVIKDSLENIGKYSYTQDKELIKLIAQNDHVNEENILITAGCDGALRIISRLFISSNTNVCIPLPSFGRYEYHAKVNEGNITYIHPSRFPFDISIEKILETQKTVGDFDLTFLANPNNPTGIYKDRKSIEELVAKLSGYLVLDESLDNPDIESFTYLVNNYQNLMVARSFSKVHGLAGARIGYIVANSELIKLLNKLVSPFEVSPVSIALATAVLKDKRYYFSSVRQIRSAHKYLERINNPAVSISNSNSSTVIIRYEKSENLYDLLLRKGIKTVDCRDFRGLEKKNCVRVSIKDLKSIRYLVDILNSI